MYINYALHHSQFSKFAARETRVKYNAGIYASMHIVESECVISALFSDVFRHCGFGGGSDEGATVWRGHKLGGNLRQTNYRCKPDASTPRTGTR